MSGNFNPRPREGATTVLLGTIDHLLISIHAPREGGDINRIEVNREYDVISIHAPREGGDARLDLGGLGQAISIHAPREGGDLGRYCGKDHCGYFNPRPPRGGRP